MTKFIIGSFLVMGVAFYELSGGADFKPDSRPETDVAAITPSQEDAGAAQADVVARATTIELPSLTPEAAETVEEEVVQASVTTTPVIAEPEITQPTIDLREVAGKRVNMRSGPSTDYRILDTLPRGTQAEVLNVNADGWAEIKIVETGQVGWMLGRLLTDG